MSRRKAAFDRKAGFVPCHLDEEGVMVHATRWNPRHSYGYEESACGLAVFADQGRKLDADEVVNCVECLAAM